MNFEWLKTIAPTVASALGGPLAGLAVQAVGSAFGWSDTTQAKVERALTSGQLSGEQLVQIKIAENELKQKELELGIKFEQLATDDRADARKRETAIRDNTNRILGFSIVIVWAVLNGILMLSAVPSGSEQLIARLLGTLDAALMLVLYYYFGSSAGSKASGDAVRNIAENLR